MLVKNGEIAGVLARKLMIFDRYERATERVVGLYELQR